MKRKSKICFLLFLFMTMLMVTSPVETMAQSVYAAEHIQPAASSAASWITGDTSAIYGDGTGTVIEEETDEKTDPTLPEKFFMWIINGFAHPFNDFLTSTGLTLNNIVLGRVGGNGIQIGNNRTALFTFELVEGNFYGIVGMAIYGVLRRSIYILVGVFITAKFAEASLRGNSVKTYAALKSSVTDGAVIIGLLSVMPNLLDMALYLRDGILYSTSISCVQRLLPNLSGMETVTSYFAENCEVSLFHSFMFIGSLFLTLWYALQYAGIALGFVVHMISFPFVCLYSFVDKNIMSGWVKEVSSSSLIPIVDSALLLVPALIGYLGSTFGNAPFAFSVMQWCVCSMLIPARAVFRKNLGLSPSLGMEMAGLMALSGAINIGRAAVGGAVGSAMKIGGGIAGYRANMNEAKRYEALDNAENGVVNEYADMVNYQTPNYSYDGYTGGSSGYGNDSGVLGISDKSPASSYALGISDKSMARSSGNTDAGQMSSPITNTTSGYSSVTPSGFSDAQRQVNEKFANTKNFENPAIFNSLSNKTKADMYRQRAKQDLFRGVGAGVGGLAGTVAGGTIGFGAGTFFSPGAQAMMMGAGSMAGGSIGSAAGYAAGEGARLMSPYVKENQNHMGQMINDTYFSNTAAETPVESFSGTVDKQELAVRSSGARATGMNEAEWQEFGEAQNVELMNYYTSNMDYFNDTYTKDIAGFMNNNGTIHNQDVADEISSVCRGIKNGTIQVPDGMTEKEATINYSAQNISTLYTEKFNNNVLNMNSSGNIEKDRTYNAAMGDVYKTRILKYDKNIIFSDSNFENLGFKFNEDGSFARD